MSDVKNETKTLVSVQDTEVMFDHVKQLVKQGKYLVLSQLEQNYANWKGYIFSLPCPGAI